jgi:hypothetical protein
LNFQVGGNGIKISPRYANESAGGLGTWYFFQIRALPAPLYSWPTPSPQDPSQAIVTKPDSLPHSEDRTKIKRGYQMKRSLAALCLIASMVFTRTAMATIWTAKGGKTPWDFKIAGPYTTQLSLLHDGFAVGDKVDFAVLAFDFDKAGVVTKVIMDLDKANFFELASVNLLGLLGVNANLLNDGILNLSVSAWDGWQRGDFTLESVCLTAEGCDKTPVPEPGTMMLLGAGFLGLAIYSKRRKTSGLRDL